MTAALLVAGCSGTTSTSELEIPENVSGIHDGPESHDFGVEPITGYGDYSDVDMLALDQNEIAQDVARCAQDQGLSVVAEGRAVSYEAVPDEQHPLATDVVRACYVGLNIPPARQLSAEELTKMYEYQVAVADCLSQMSLPTTPPPSLQVWVDSYASGPWGAYDALRQDEDTFQRAEQECPQHPARGYATWEIGDPLG